MKNGKLVCLSFDHPNVKPIDLSKKRSSEVSSYASDVFKVRPNLHAGMRKKPLEKYQPNAFRSRLSSPNIVMPYKNSSQIVIGDRSTYNKRQYVTTMNNNFTSPFTQITSNQGIISELTKQIKHKKEL